MNPQVAVAEGGGECGLDNMQTLCVVRAFVDLLIVANISISSL
jgi:hypothetical protein